MATNDGGLLAGLDIGSLRQRLADPVYRPAWDLASASWRRLAAQPEEGRWPNYGSLGWHSVTPRVVEAAIEWRLTGAPEALAYVHRCMDRLALVWDNPGAARAGWPPAERPVLSHGEVALAAAACRDGLDPARRQTLVRLMREHLIDYSEFKHSLAGHGAGRNIPLCRNLQAAMAALAWGRESGHPAWEEVVRKGIDTCRLYLRRGCDEAGFSYEGTGYSHAVFDYIYLYAQLLAQAGAANLFETEPQLRRIPDASVQLLFPDRSHLVNINDLGLAHPPSMFWLLLTAHHYREPAHLGLWYAYEGPDHPVRAYGQPLYTFLYWDAAAPCVPVERSAQPLAVCARGTGTAAFRTSWGHDAIFLNVLGGGRGHAAGGHAHADCGHFSIFAHGDYLAIDTGRYNVNEDQHSVVLVDGRNHMEVPEGTWGANSRSGSLPAFQRHAWLDYVKADAAHMKNCLWADRHILFVRLGGDDAYIVILDNLNPDNAAHSFLWQLQANPASRVRLTGERTAAVEGTHARLDVFFAIPGPGDYPTHPHALSLRTDEKWWAWPYGRTENTAVFEGTLATTSLRRPRLLGELSGLNGVMAAVIVPRRRGAPALAVRQIASPRVLRVEIETPLGTDTLVAALDHGYVDLPDMKGLTELALVRRPASGEPALCWTVDGEPLDLRSPSKNA